MIPLGLVTLAVTMCFVALIPGSPAPPTAGTAGDRGQGAEGRVGANFTLDPQASLSNQPVWIQTAHVAQFLSPKLC
jgi:hypothetical protein